MLKNKILLFLIFLGPLLLSLQAQEIISTSGNHFESPNLQISWTIGEPVIETITNSEYNLTQGFHQSLLSVTPIRSIQYPNIEVKAYPNPASEVVNLSISAPDLTGWVYCLYSADGRLLFEKEAGSSISQIQIGQYTASNYVLRVFKGGNEVRSFKIIKN